MTNEEKYNNLTSIDVYSLSEEELKIAIHEWAEGDEVMEKLLWKCYENGVETKQCHAGGGPFLQVSADRNANKVKNMIISVCDANGFSVLISPDGGSPFSGDVFYKAGLTVSFLKTMYKSEADVLFNKMISSLDKKETIKNKMTDSLIDLYNFFREKESDVEFRVDLNDGKYKFSVVSDYNSRLNEYNDMFIKAGLVFDSESYFSTWTFESYNLEDFGNKLENVSNIIMNSYYFERPEKIEENMSFNEKFRVLRRKFVERDGNDLLYREFISRFYEEFNQAQIDFQEGRMEEEVAQYWLIDKLRAIETEVSDNQSLN